MISKTQFVYLINGLLAQNELESKFNNSLSLINTSFSVVELCPNLIKSIFKIVEEDFTETAIDILCEYLYNGKTIFEWSDGIDYKYNIDNIEIMYDIFMEHFLTNKHPV